MTKQVNLWRESLWISIAAVPKAFAVKTGIRLHKTTTCGYLAPTVFPPFLSQPQPLPQAFLTRFFKFLFKEQLVVSAGSSGTVPDLNIVCIQPKYYNDCDSLRQSSEVSPSFPLAFLSSKANEIEWNVGKHTFSRWSFKEMLQRLSSGLRADSVPCSMGLNCFFSPLPTLKIEQWLSPPHLGIRQKGIVSPPNVQGIGN